eukprot:jgi/Mesvir1/22525/Mv18547-RA.1
MGACLVKSGHGKRALRSKSNKSPQAKKNKMPDVKSGLERQLERAIKARSTEPNRKQKSFNSIVLSFPRIERTFNDCRIEFKEFDADSSGTIEYNELRECFRRLGVQFNENDLKEIFQEADIDHSHAISFKEFIVCLALVYLTRPHATEERKEIVQLEKTIETIVDAFLHFDRDCDGYVTRDEVTVVFSEASPGASSGVLSEKRFDEMDHDGMGRISFKEFLFAFATWVGVEDEEDGQEEQN